jgi:hypothetical protein
MLSIFKNNDSEREKALLRIKLNEMTNAYIIKCKENTNLSNKIMGLIQGIQCVCNREQRDMIEQIQTICLYGDEIAHLEDCYSVEIDN